VCCILQAIVGSKRDGSYRQIYICIDMCIYIYICTCIYSNMYICTCSHINTSIDAYIHIKANEPLCIVYWKAIVGDKRDGC